MGAAEKSRRQAAAAKVRNTALYAARWAEFTRLRNRPFYLGDLPDADRRSARALLSSAIAHCLYSPGSQLPKTMRWLNRRWYLKPAGMGRLEVSASTGFPGLMSMPGALR